MVFLYCTCFYFQFPDKIKCDIGKTICRPLQERKCSSYQDSSQTQNNVTDQRDFSADTNEDYCAEERNQKDSNLEQGPISGSFSAKMTLQSQKKAPSDRIKKNNRQTLWMPCNVMCTIV